MIGINDGRNENCDCQAVLIEKDMVMTSDVITICAGIIGLAYLAVAGILFEVDSASKHHSLGRPQPKTVRVRRGR